MKKIAYTGLLLFFVALRGMGSQLDESCLITACAEGDRGTTYASKSDPYYA